MKSRRARAAKVDRARETAALAPKPRLFAEWSATSAPEPGADPEPGPSRPPRWRALFAAASPREILARIVPEDPLELRSVVARRLQQQALLADADRVHLRSLALVARWAPRYQGDPEFHTWLERIVDRALLEVVEEPPGNEVGSEAESAGALQPQLAALGLTEAGLRRAWRSFNRLPLEERQAFFALVLAGRPLQELVRASGRSAVEIARSARRGLDAVLSQPATDQVQEDCP
jgi:DNA-directed RNA polymerase specialized sigma24 family protein